MPVALIFMYIALKSRVESEGEAMSSEYEYGCLFCRTGKEEEVSRNMTHEFPGLKAIVPKKSRYRRSHGIATEETVILFPGYVFFMCDHNIQIRDYLKREDVYRILTDGEGSWILQGTDRIIAKELFLINGRIGISQAYYVGGRIKVVDGFLKDFEGDIIRVNHRARTAQIQVRLDGRVFSLWVGFELISLPDNDKRIVR